MILQPHKQPCWHKDFQGLGLGGTFGTRGKQDLATAMAFAALQCFRCCKIFKLLPYLGAFEYQAWYCPNWGALLCDRYSSSDNLPCAVPVVPGITLLKKQL